MENFTIVEFRFSYPWKTTYPIITEFDLSCIFNRHILFLSHMLLPFHWHPLSLVAAITKSTLTFINLQSQSSNPTPWSDLSMTCIHVTFLIVFIVLSHCRQDEIESLGIAYKKAPYFIYLFLIIYPPEIQNYLPATHIIFLFLNMTHSVTHSCVFSS